MSYFVDRYVIYKSHRKEPLEKLRKFIAGEFWEAAERWNVDDEFSWEKLRNYIQPVNESLRNGVFYLFIAPDGSKEGWDVSQLMDEVIASIEKYIDEWNFKDEGREWAEQIKYFYVYDDEYQEGYRVARRDILND